MRFLAVLFKFLIEGSLVVFDEDGSALTWLKLNILFHRDKEGSFELGTLLTSLWLRTASLILGSGEKNRPAAVMFLLALVPVLLLMILGMRILFEVVFDLTIEMFIKLLLLTSIRLYLYI